MNTILSGIRVLEVSTAIQGPAAGQFLADLGAEVIKIEPPMGDSARYIGRADVTRDAANAADAGSQFIAVNRGKQSVCLDAHSPRGRAVLHRLATQADVFLSNYRAPALKRMQLDAPTLTAMNPQLIYAGVSGFGPLGADADKAMVDSAAQARGGLLFMTGPPNERPTLPGATLADTAGAMTLALGVVCALLDRERTGRVRRVDTSALAAQLWLQMWELQHAALTGITPMRAGAHHAQLSGPVGVYASSDGEYYQFALILDINAWQAFWAFAGEPEVAFDARWDLPAKQFAVGDGAPDVEAMRACMLRGFARRTSAEWDAFFAAQPELICERVRAYDAVLADAQNLANGAVASMALTPDRQIATIGNPLVFDRAPRHHYPAPPDRGGATVRVMQGLGFSDVDIEQLQAHTDLARRKLMGLA